MPQSGVIAAYVSGHGFGHAVRVSQVLERLLEHNPALEIHVRTSAPARLFPLAPGRLSVRSVATDVGMVQPNGVDIDFEATLARLGELDDDWDRKSDLEAAWLAASRARLVLGDIPPLAFEAARRAGVPALALGNFTWDWVYGCYAERDRRFVRHAERAAAGYAGARRWLRLPFHPDTRGVFASVVDLPVVARRIAWSRSEARRLLDLPADRPVVLLSFGGFGTPGLEMRGFAEMAEMLFVSTERRVDPPPNLVDRTAAARDYGLLLAASDAVLTKPGYGIVASSLVNGLRLLCVEREDFPESPILLRALAEQGTAERISADDFARGRFRAPLEALLARPVAARAEANGVDDAARLIEGELDR